MLLERIIYGFLNSSRRMYLLYETLVFPMRAGAFSSVPVSYNLAVPKAQKYLAELNYIFHCQHEAAQIKLMGIITSQRLLCDEVLP